MNKLLLLPFLCLVLASCHSSLKGDTYSRQDAQRTLHVKPATVISVRPVVIEGDRSEKGQIAGAVIGGAAGHSSTQSRSQGVATAVGAVAGAIAGQAIEEKMSRAQGIEITLRMKNGEVIAIVQETDDINEFSPGDKVKVVSGGGKLRVTH